MSKIITWLLYVLTFSLGGNKNAVIMERPPPPQPTVCKVYNMFIVLLCIQLIIIIQIIMEKQVNIFVFIVHL